MIIAEIRPAGDPMLPTELVKSNDTFNGPRRFEISLFAGTRQPGRGEDIDALDLNLAPNRCPLPTFRRETRSLGSRHLGGAVFRHLVPGYWNQASSEPLVTADRETVLFPFLLQLNGITPVLENVRKVTEAPPALLLNQRPRFCTFIRWHRNAP